MPATLRAPYETALGYDFSQVRIHDTPADATVARTLGARAFTYGDDVVLDRSAESVAPGTLAHELVHVAQQRSARDGEAAQVAPQSSPFEANADAVAARVMRGDTSAGTHIVPASRRAVHRQSTSALPAVAKTQLTMRHGDPLAPAPLVRPLQPHLLAEDLARIDAFLALHAFRVGQRLRPYFDGASTTLEAIVGLVRPLVLPIIPRTDVQDYIWGRWRGMVTDELARAPLPPIPPAQIANIFATIPAAPAESTDHARPTFSAAVNYAWHVALAPGYTTTSDRTLQLQIGEDAQLQRIFQVSYNVDNQQTQVVVGGQATSADVKLVGELLKITGFVQVLAGIAWTGSPASGIFTMLQPSAGGQITLDFGPVQLSLQAAASVTAVQGSATTAEVNVTPQITIPLESKPKVSHAKPESNELTGQLEIRDWIDGVSFSKLQRIDAGEKGRLMRSLVGGGAIIDADIDAITKLWEATPNFERPPIRSIVEGALSGIGDPARQTRLRDVLKRPAFPR